VSTEEVLQLTEDHAAWRSVVHHAANAEREKQVNNIHTNTLYRYEICIA